MARCSNCGDPILWATSEKSGKKVPVDFGPREDGNIELIRKPGVADPVARFLTKAELEGQIGFDAGERYVHHRATCPHADEWTDATRA